MRKHERRASRLDALLCNILGISTVAIFILSCAGTFVTKLHMFQQALTKRRKHYEDNMWLEEQCNQAEFYQKMKHHSTICDDIALARSDSLWLHALRDVVDKSSVCGSQSCEERLTVVLAWMFGPGLFITLTLIISLFLIIALCYPICKHFTCRTFNPYHRTSFVMSNGSQDYSNLDGDDLNALNCREVQSLQDHRSGRSGHRQLLLRA